MYYYNMAGQRFILPERLLEPQYECGEYDPDPTKDGWWNEEEYDRAEDEMNGKFNRLCS